MKNFKLIERSNPEIYYSAKGKFIYSDGTEIKVENGKLTFVQDGNLVKQDACLVALRAYGFIPKDLSLDLFDGLLENEVDGYILKNLYYVHKEKIETKYKGFYKIPYFENYAINKLGKIISLRKDKFLSFHKTKPNEKRNSLGGYRVCRMVSNTGRSLLMLRHRALCYTFKRPPSNPKFLVINHLNGIPGSDDLDNLEWTTHSKNIEHAIRMGLKKNTVSVLHKDLSTGIITRYPSVQSCARG